MQICGDNRWPQGSEIIYQIMFALKIQQKKSPLNVTRIK
jgi:hypothetical protein